MGGSCWRSVEYQLAINGAPTETKRRWGCEQTICTSNYKNLQCYYTNPRQTEVICSNCCGGLELSSASVNDSSSALLRGCNGVKPGGNFEIELQTELHKRIWEAFGGSLSVELSRLILVLCISGVLLFSL